jgi:ABC-type transport system involved in multi-copper enzyme maturation permease subunit
MSQRLFPLTSAFMLGVFVFALYAFRCTAASLIAQAIGGGQSLITTCIFGPWLPGSGRLAFALSAFVILLVVALGRALRHSPAALLALHAVLWMLCIITLPVILWAQDLALIVIGKGLTFPTPEQEKQWQTEQLYEASWFWVLAALAGLALYASLKSPSTRNALP